MKSFKELREDCDCAKKEKKGKNKPEVEIMPTIKDGLKGTVTKS